MDADERSLLLLPHELVFGAFLLLTCVRLLLAEGAGGSHAPWFLALLAGSAAAAGLRSWRPRLVFYLVAAQAIFYLIRPAVDALRPLRADAMLERADLLLLGFNPNLALERFSSPWLSDALSVCYLLAFMPYVAFAFVSYARGELATFKRFGTGLFTVYALGFLGYTLCPAVGPYASMAARFHGPIPGSWLTSAHHAFVVRGTNGIDAFPSLHCALTAYVLFFDRRSKPRRFRVMLAPVALLWVATVYLRYHYAVDVAAGFAAAAAGLWASRQPGLRRFSRSRSFCS
jgi:hypothetical protein